RRMRKSIGIGLGIAIALMLAWRWRAHPTASTPTATSGSAAIATQPAQPDTGVRRLSPDERRKGGEHNPQAIAHRSSAAPSTDARSSSRGSAPALADAPTIPLEQVGKPLHDALTAAIPLLADCFKQHGATAAAQMTMWSDPDTGTVIDTKALHDGSGQP